MHSFVRRHLLLAAIASLASAISSKPAFAGDSPIATAALDAYVAKEDATYKWRETREGKLGTADYAELILTSQTWKGIPWKHQLFLLRPAQAAADARHCLLLIGGGNWNDISMGSNHPGGVNVALGDASVRFVRESVDLNRVLKPSASRAGGEVVSDF